MNLNIFVIPSWYPDAHNRVSGVFIREQVLAIGELRPHWRVAVSLGGQSAQSLSFRSPRHNYRIIKEYLQDSKNPVCEISPNVMELRKPVFRWTPRIARGNWPGVIAANLQNLQLTQELWKEVHLIHAHVSYPAGKIAMELSHQTQIPYVVTEHMGPFPFPVYLDSRGGLIPEVREPLKKAHASIAVSPFLAEKMKQFRLPDPVVVPNLVNETLFKPPKTFPDKGETPFRFLTVCAMVPEKGIYELLEAISIMVGKGSPDTQVVQFRLLGEGPEKHSARHRAQSLGISSYIKWLDSPSREEVRREFQQCDAFVLPSHYETFGVVYAEAMACGKPVIATRCGGPESMVNQQNGMLVEVKNVTQLSSALKQMYEGAGNYDSQMIRRDFMERFSREAVVNSLEKVYNKVKVIKCNY
ncbi:glycosyltransferase [Candidatus Contubernalis alkaliaceticus]|uniref:glycosyltransferase n=1 Tax=Candidatus Contubernalis alkaliaceticus TaxID=338645 RepID=UPI001F4BFB26|nr:glycosyltransferase [Candidatus Contubernalis alkalaceticus]UNC93629.1 glycosyltransferase [Candidatus Contubernalis alkalaceticus]